jgi:hypothetical protein
VLGATGRPSARRRQAGTFAVGRPLSGCAPELLEPPVNVVRLCPHPEGLAGRTGNRAEWGGHLLRQVRHRADRTHDRRHRELAAEIAGYLGGSGAAIPGTGPVITLEIDVDGARLRFFGTSATLSAAHRRGPGRTASGDVPAGRRGDPAQVRS